MVLSLVILYGVTNIPGRTRKHRVIATGADPFEIPKKASVRYPSGGYMPTSNIQYIIDCPERIRDTYDWAQYVIFFGLIGVMWSLVAIAVFCFPIGPGGKAVAIVAGLFLTVVCTIFSLAAPDLMFKAFYFAFRTSICEMRTSES